MVYQEKSQIHVTSLPQGDCIFPQGSAYSLRGTRTGPAPGPSWHSVNSGGMNGPSVSEGRAVPVIGGLSNGKIMIFLFKKWALRECILLSGAFPYVEPNHHFPEA